MTGIVYTRKFRNSNVCCLGTNGYYNLLIFVLCFFLNKIIVGSQLIKVSTVSKMEFSMCLPFPGKGTLIVKNKLRKLFAS